MPKINSIRKYITSPEKLLAAAVLLFLIVISTIQPLSAQSVVQGYDADSALQRGMLVAVKDKESNKVEALTDKTLEKLKGVVVQPNDSPVTISSGDQKTFVATNGIYNVLVTNENGKIKQGDYLSISSLAGLAMKAADTQPYVVGRAAQDFEGGGDSLGTNTTKDGRQVQFGLIKVDISISRNPALKLPEKDRVPDALQKLSRSIADKPVSSVRIYIALTVFIITSIIAGAMAYSGVRSSLISIGRNPLSKASIYRGLLQVVILSLIIFLAGVFGVYLLLKL